VHDVPDIGQQCAHTAHCRSPSTSKMLLPVLLPALPCQGSMACPPSRRTEQQQPGLGRAQTKHLGGWPCQPGRASTDCRCVHKTACRTSTGFLALIHRDLVGLGLPGESARALLRPP
jgi:hypothetical protein